MLAIIVIQFNTPNNVSELQKQAIEKFCLDKYDLHIIDNSPNKLPHNLTNPTESHSWALNFAKQNISINYDYTLYLDHDCIPIVPFSVFQTLNNYNVAGLPQVNNNINYFWPGCFMVSKSVNTDFNFDFSHELKLDTGGGTRILFENENCIYFSEKHLPINNQITGYYTFYSFINDTFIHFINTSNWNIQKDNDKRIDLLCNFVKTNYL